MLIRKNTKKKEEYKRDTKTASASGTVIQKDDQEAGAEEEKVEGTQFCEVLDETEAKNEPEVYKQITQSSRQPPEHENESKESAVGSNEVSKSEESKAKKYNEDYKADDN
eukprot:TRINITY_DN4258_c0_g2_i4.p4 TRINITY_DN4258_c0_g2~~TRINITY_DN4258_c0_g2_i4.p4  ORF type:complete len:110 (+),score=26.41 TRINITY_DN4258_c0_g2_i4:611-940(+)